MSLTASLSRTFRGVTATGTNSTKIKSILEKLDMTKLDDEIGDRRSELKAIVDKYMDTLSPANKANPGFKHPAHIEVCIFFIDALRAYLDLKNINNRYRQDKEGLKARADDVSALVRFLQVRSSKVTDVELYSITDNEDRRKVLKRRKTDVIGYINNQIRILIANGYNKISELLIIGGRRKSTVRRKRSSRKTRRH